MKNKFFIAFLSVFFLFGLTACSNDKTKDTLVALKVQVVKQVLPVKTHFHVLNQLKVTQQILL